MNSRNPALTTAIACAAMALAASAIGVALGHPRAGIALAAGLLVGSVNGYLAERAVGLGVAFLATSLGRLVALSAAGLGAGLLLGLDVAWLSLVGLAAAQFVLVAAAIRKVAQP